MDVHDTIGFDLVGMVVDDLVVCGAEPLFMTDYIACGRVVPERIAAIVKGIAEACVEAGCALVGGETAEHPGLLEPDDVRRRGRDHRRRRGRRLLGPARVRPGRRGARDGLERAALQRLLAGPPRAARAGGLGATTATSPSSAAPSARSCSSRPGSTPRPASRWPRATGRPRDGARHRRRARRQPRPGAARGAARHARARHLDAGADLRPGPPGSATYPSADLEATLNCGVGMVALLDPGDVDAAIALLAGFGDPRLGGRRGDRPTSGAAEAPSNWSVSTPAGNDRGPLEGDFRTVLRAFQGTGVREQPASR